MKGVSQQWLYDHIRLSHNVNWQCCTCKNADDFLTLFLVNSLNRWPKKIEAFSNENSLSIDPSAQLFTIQCIGWCWKWVSGHSNTLLIMTKNSYLHNNVNQWLINIGKYWQTLVKTQWPFVMPDNVATML